MTQMPDEIYAVWGDSIYWDGSWDKNPIVDCTKYIRSDIHEAEISKLRNALDLAEKALDELVFLNDTYSPFGGEIYKDKVETTWANARQALTAIKQARGEG